MIEPISYGWKCPCCGRVYNPRQEMCLYCGGSYHSDVVKPSQSTKPLDGISWTSGYCNSLTSAIDNSWTTITGCCNTIGSATASNSAAINGEKLSSAIEKKVKEKMTDAVTVQTNS